MIQILAGASMAASGGRTQAKLPSWMANYPGLRAVVHPIAQLLRDAVQHDDAEFELRLMRSLPKWSSNTGGAYSEFMSRCHDARTGNGLSFGEWAEHTDFFYTHDGRLMRSRVTYDGNTYDVQTVTSTKETLGRVDMVVADSPWGIRADARREINVADADVPAVVLASRVCMSTRCSGVWPPSSPVWQYDVTLQYGGDSRLAAERNQRDENVPPVAVIELEFIGSSDYVRAHGAVQAVVSALLKVLDIVGCQGSECRLRDARSPA